MVASSDYDPFARRKCRSDLLHSSIVTTTTSSSPADVRKNPSISTKLLSTDPVDLFDVHEKLGMDIQISPIENNTKN